MKDESDTTVLLDYTKAGAWNIAEPQHIIFEGCDSVVMAPEDFENIQADAERYRRVREFLQRGNGLLDTRGMDDAGFDRMIDSLKECGK